MFLEKDINIIYIFFSFFRSKDLKASITQYRSHLSRPHFHFEDFKWTFLNLKVSNTPLNLEVDEITKFVEDVLQD